MDTYYLRGCSKQEIKKKQVRFIELSNDHFSDFEVEFEKID